MSAPGNRGRAIARPIAPMYDHLPKGPHNIGPGQVVEHQRRRMLGAIVESVAVRGYEETKVKHIIGLAGVSRRAFYEQFANKEHCFLEAFDCIAKATVSHVREVCETIDGEMHERLLGGLNALSAQILEHPKEARALFVEAPITGAAGARRLEQLTGAFERLLASSLADASGESVPAVLVRVVVGAVRETISFALTEGRAEELVVLNERMLGWLLLLGEPTVSELHTLMRSDAAERLRVLQALAVWDITEDPRELLLDAALRAAAATTHDELSAIQISELAGMSLDSFFEHFDHHQQCFLAAVEFFAGQATVRVERAQGDGDDRWAVRLCRSLSALTSHLAAHPAFARAIFGGACEAGAEGVECERRLSRELVMAACSAIPEQSVDDVVTAQVAGAIRHTVSALRAAERPHLIAVLDGYIAYLALAPIIGGQLALEAIAEARSGNAQRDEQLHPIG